MEGPRLERRIKNVRILLQTLNDIYPGPTALQQPASSGLAPSRRVPCGVCNPSAREPRKRLTGCLNCDGSGWRRRRTGEDEYDEYTGTKVATAEQPKRPEPMSPARLEAEIAKVQHDLILREGLVDPTEAYGWEKARAARDREASYEELEYVLGLMQIELPLARSAVNGAYLSGLAVPLHPHLDRALMVWIAERMRGKIRIPKRFYEEQQAQLKEEILELHSQGLDERAIALTAGSSTRYVRTVLAGTLRVSVGPAAATVSARPSGNPGAAIS